MNVSLQLKHRYLVQELGIESQLDVEVLEISPSGRFVKLSGDTTQSWMAIEEIILIEELPLREFADEKRLMLLEARDALVQFVDDEDRGRVAAKVVDRINAYFEEPTPNDPSVVSHQ